MPRVYSVLITGVLALALAGSAVAGSLNCEDLGKEIDISPEQISEELPEKQIRSVLKLQCRGELSGERRQAVEELQRRGALPPPLDELFSRKLEHGELAVTGSFEDGVSAYDKGNYREAIQIFWKLANQGDLRAQYRVGLMYDNGEAVPKDYGKAVKWYRTAAEQGYTQAQHRLGFIYVRGRGVPKDKAKAEKWYRKAMEQWREGARHGNPQAQYRLALMYKQGQGVSRDRSKAMKWYRKAAKQGHAEAQYELGGIYRFNDVPEDNSKAMEWLRKAAEQGHSYASLALAQMYYTGHQPAKGAKWYRKAIERGAINQARAAALIWEVAHLAYEREDYKEAFQIFKESANLGDVGAQFKVGLMYANGQGVPQIIEYAYPANSG